jgi:hypothetical protein
MFPFYRRSVKGELQMSEFLMNETVCEDSSGELTSCENGKSGR